MISSAEAELQHKVEAVLQALRVRYARNNSGGRGNVKFGLRARGVSPPIESGGPDLMVFHLGRVIGIELKAPGEEPTAEQIRWFKHFAQARFATYVVESVEAAKEALKLGLSVPIGPADDYTVAERWRLSQDWGAYVRAN